jgi:hypothetical protein
MNGYKKDASFRGAAKAGLKKMDQRHMNFTQRNCLNFHHDSLKSVSNRQLAISKTRQPQIFADKRRSENEVVLRNPAASFCRC